MECEICGKREAVCFVYLEGAKMNSCASCARGGKVLYYFDSGDAVPLLPARPAKAEEEIADNYGKIIKEARMKMGLSLEGLGLKIAEKANYLDHVEREATLPSLPLARKLEKFLKIKLVESETAQAASSKPAPRKGELTLLDVAEIERKGEKPRKK